MPQELQLEEGQKIATLSVRVAHFIKRKERFDVRDPHWAMNKYIPGQRKIGIRYSDAPSLLRWFKQYHLATLELSADGEWTMKVHGALLVPVAQSLARELEAKFDCRINLELASQESRGAFGPD